MPTKRNFRLVVFVIFGLSLVLPSTAASVFTGRLLFGFRLVEASGPGAHYKYKEDLNLQSGARLYNFSLVYRPDSGLDKWLDRLDFQMTNFGGDPFESLTLSLQKHGHYSMKYERKKSTYFYQDLHQPEGNNLYDLHTFGFDRVMERGAAKIQLSRKIDFLFNFDRFKKSGHSRTTQDIERVEFELDKPVEEEAKEISVGMDARFGRFSLFLEEKRREFRNENSLFLKGYADGGASAVYPTSLEFYFLNQPYKIESSLHTLILRAKPVGNLLFVGRVAFTEDSLKLDYSESASGIDYLGRTIHMDAAGKGAFQREMKMYDLDVSYILMKKLILLAAVRYHKFDQSGSLTGNEESLSMHFGYNILTAESGFQYSITPALSLALGYRREKRKLEGLETATYEFQTERQGYFGNIKWNWRALDMTLDYEHSASQEPFNLMSAKDFDRLRLTTRYKWKNFNLTGTYLWVDRQGQVFEESFASSRNQLGLQAGYHGSRVQVFAGYSQVNVEHRAVRTVSYPPFWTGPGGVFLWDILYEGKSTLLDASFSVKLKEKLKVGLVGNSYLNRGSWGIQRAMVKAYSEIVLHPGYVAQLIYRYIDFKEKKSGFNDYRASLLELSFGYGW